MIGRTKLDSIELPIDRTTPTSGAPTRNASAASFGATCRTGPSPTTARCSSVSPGSSAASRPWSSMAGPLRHPRRTHAPRASASPAPTHLRPLDRVCGARIGASPGLDLLAQTRSIGREIRPVSRGSSIKVDEECSSTYIDIMAKPRSSREPPEIRIRGSGSDPWPRSGSSSSSWKRWVRNARGLGWSWQEIADELRVSRQAVRKKHARGRILARRVAVFERFTTQARSVATLAQQEGRKLGRPNIGTQHLLLGILGAPDTAGARALDALGVGERDVREDVRSLDRDRSAFSDQDADALRSVGIDLDEVRRTVEQTFGSRAPRSGAASRARLVDGASLHRSRRRRSELALPRGDPPRAPIHRDRAPPARPGEERPVFGGEGPGGTRRGSRARSNGRAARDRGRRRSTRPHRLADRLRTTNEKRIPSGSLVARPADAASASQVGWVGLVPRRGASMTFEEGTRRTSVCICRPSPGTRPGPNLSR